MEMTLIRNQQSQNQLMVLLFKTILLFLIVLMFSYFITLLNLILGIIIAIVLCVSIYYYYYKTEKKVLSYLSYDDGHLNIYFGYGIKKISLENENVNNIVFDRGKIIVREINGNENSFLYGKLEFISDNIILINDNRIKSFIEVNNCIST